MNNEFFGDLISKFDQAIKENDSEEIARLEKLKPELLKDFVMAMEGKVRKMGVSALAYDALAFFDIHKNYEFLQEMNTNFQALIPNSGMSRDLQKRMQLASQVAIGVQAPDFTTVSIEGSNIALKDFRGKYLLIDFWASWCRACRVENPKFVSLYQTYKNKGFEIISVSIDEDRGLWKEAIGHDGLTWTQILDQDHELYNLFMLSSLPSNFLLDTEGTIVGKNVDAIELAKQLSELLAN